MCVKLVIGCFSNDVVAAGRESLSHRHLLPQRRHMHVLRDRRRTCLSVSNSPLSLSLFSLTLSFIPLRLSPIVTLKTYVSVVPCREFRQVTAKRLISLGWHHSAAEDGKILLPTPKPIENLNRETTQKETIFIVKHPQSNPDRFLPVHSVQFTNATSYTGYRAFIIVINRW